MLIDRARAAVSRDASAAAPSAVAAAAAATAACSVASLHDSIGHRNGERDGGIRVECAGASQQNAAAIAAAAIVANELSFAAPSGGESRNGRVIKSAKQLIAHAGGEGYS